MAIGSKQNFLWIKVVKVPQGSLTAVTETGSSTRWPPSDPDAQPAHGLLDARMQAPLAKLEKTFSAVELANAAPRPAGALEMLSGTRPPGVYAGAVSNASWWNFDREYCGDPKSQTRIVAHPYIGTRDEAVAWFTGTTDGKDWQKDALNCALLSFDQWMY